MKKNNMFGFFFLLVLFNMAASFAHPVTPTIIKELNLGDYMFGVALGAMLLCNFLFSPFFGKLNNYIPSKVTILVCAIGYAIGQVLFGLADSGAMLIFARMFAGVFTGGVFVSFLTYIVNHSSDDNRAKNLAIGTTIQSVAGAFGYFVGGTLGEVGVQLTIFMQAAILFITGLLFYVVLEDDRIEKKSIPFKTVVKEAHPFMAFKSCGEFITITFLCIFGVAMLAGTGYTAFEQSFNYYLKDQFGLTSSYNGIIKGGIGLIALVANMTLCMYIIKKTDVSKSLIYVLSICSLAMLFVVLLNDVIPFIIVNIMFFTFYAVTTPLIQNLISKRSKESDSNLIMGLYNATKSLGGIIGAFVAGGIYTIHPKLPFVFGLMAFTLAGVLAYIYYYRNKHIM